MAMHDFDLLIHMPTEFTLFCERIQFAEDISVHSETVSQTELSTSKSSRQSCAEMIDILINNVEGQISFWKHWISKGIGGGCRCRHKGRHRVWLNSGWVIGAGVFCFCFCFCFFLFLFRFRFFLLVPLFFFCVLFYFIFFIFFLFLFLFICLFICFFNVLFSFVFFFNLFYCLNRLGLFLLCFVQQQCYWCCW